MLETYSVALAGPAVHTLFLPEGGKKALLFGSNALVYQLASWKSDSDMISRKHVILRVCMLLAVQTPFSINLLHCCLF